MTNQFDEEISGAIKGFSKKSRAFADDDCLEKIVAPVLPESSGYEKQRSLFVSALEKLSRPNSRASLDTDTIDGFIKFFVSLYGEDVGYRHMYSDVCSVMYCYLKKERELDYDELPRELLTLCDNFALILLKMGSEIKEQTIADPKDYNRAVACVRKLHDHIELERTRLDYLLLQNKWLATTSYNAAGAIRNARLAIDKIEREYKEMINRSKRDYVTILGIFAAIVLTFTTGFAFSASILQNIAAASLFRLLLVALLLGCFLFNLIAVLLVFIGKISNLLVRKSIWGICWRFFLPINSVFAVMLVLLFIFRFALN